MADNSCQTHDQTMNENQGLNTIWDHSCFSDQVTTDTESLKSKMSTLQSTVLSFENVLRDHDTILSLYNRAAELNDKYLKEINEKNQYINSLEQNLAKVQEERDSLQLATRLIAQDKLYQHQNINCQTAANTNIITIMHHGKIFLKGITTLVNRPVTRKQQEQTCKIDMSA